MRTANRNALHTRQRAEATLEFAQESDALFVLRVLLAAKSHMRRHESINLPARIRVNEAVQATQKQSCRCQQNKRKRHFADDERVSQPVLRSPGSRSARVLSQGEVHVRPRR
jgi:hypothetical protein